MLVKERKFSKLKSSKLSLRYCFFSVSTLKPLKLRHPITNSCKFFGNDKVNIGNGSFQFVILEKCPANSIKFKQHWKNFDWKLTSWNGITFICLHISLGVCLLIIWTLRVKLLCKHKTFDFEMSNNSRESQFYSFLLKNPCSWGSMTGLILLAVVKIF